MIIYGLISNHGGMLRVVESLENVFRDLPADFPLRVFIFSEIKPFEFTSDKFVWFKVDKMEGDSFGNYIVRLREEVNKYLEGEKVKWVIADFMTLDIFKDIDARICYDVHFLGRPFFESLSHYKNMNVIDEISGKTFILSLHLQHLSFVKFESRLMRKASRFIVNSQASWRTLNESYKDVCEGKKINYIPVSSELAEPTSEINLVTSGLYFHGRFHPQKGLHFLIHESWHDIPLTIRGIEESYLTEETLALFKKQNITPLPWTWDSQVIRHELLSHSVILFPSIYEPWGLSLQEALALGKICIAHTSQSGHEEQIVNGVNGFLIDFSQPDFKRRILEIYNLSDEEKSRISIQAKKMSQLGHGNRIKMLEELLLELKAE